VFSGLTTTFSLTTLSITTFSITIRKLDHKDTLLKGTFVMLNVLYAECHFC